MSAIIAKIVFATLSLLFLMGGAYATKDNYKKKPVIFAVSFLFLIISSSMFLIDLNGSYEQLLSPEEREGCSSNYVDNMQLEPDSKLTFRVFLDDQRAHLYIDGKHKLAFKIKAVNPPRGSYRLSSVRKNMNFPIKNISSDVHCVSLIGEVIPIYGLKKSNDGAEPVINIGIEISYRDSAILYSLINKVGIKKTKVVIF